MSDDKSNVSDKASEIAKNIWLAGLGAYGKAFDEAQDRLEQAAKEPSRFFKDLVKKGSRLEGEVKGSLTNIRKSRAGSVEERIGRIKENFNLNLIDRGEELARINAKLDELTRKVDALGKALGAKPAKKKPAAKKKTPAKRKAPARKSAARAKKS